MALLDPIFLLKKTVEQGFYIIIYFNMGLEGLSFFNFKYLSMYYISYVLPCTLDYFVTLLLYGSMPAAH